MYAEDGRENLVVTVSVALAESHHEIYKIYKKDKKITKGTPTGGLARMISLMESDACTRVYLWLLRRWRKYFRNQPW